MEGVGNEMGEFGGRDGLTRRVNIGRWWWEFGAGKEGGDCGGLVCLEGIPKLMSAKGIGLGFKKLLCPSMISS